MASVSETRKLAWIGNYLRRKCGIATFPSDLFQPVASRYPAIDCVMAPVNENDVSAHGIPDTPLVSLEPGKERFGGEGKHVVLTFGLLSPNNDTEHPLEALSEVIRR